MVWLTRPFHARIWGIERRGGGDNKHYWRCREREGVVFISQPTFSPYVWDSVNADYPFSHNNSAYITNRNEEM